MTLSLPRLLEHVKQCTVCEQHLALGPRPVIQLNHKAKILIAGQAPGKKVHQSGIPFDDASGKRLRQWLGLSEDLFYDPNYVAILPMGFCFPGTGKSGDLPPRPECAPTWRAKLLEHLQQLEITLVIGQYAQHYHFPDKKMSVTDRVKSWQDYWPKLVPLPHPSQRNALWLRKNPWFEQELLPELRSSISTLISSQNK